MPPRRNPTLLAALDRLAAVEHAFVGADFLAPVLRGLGVGVRIEGVHCRLRVHPPTFEGWGLFRAVAHDRAALTRPMTLAERRRYLALFPPVRLILCRHEQGGWLALPASRADTRFSIDGLIPVRFVEEADLFDTVVARFDGGQFWFDAPDDRADPAVPSLLRGSLAESLDPDKLHRPGLTPEQRAAYAVQLRARLEATAHDERHRAESRLRLALEHAGAELRDYAEQGDVYRVSYRVDDRRHTSIVRKSDLTVVTAGICLSGQDQTFDLASLVSVLREGEQGGSIVRTPWR
jgi:hypothetical protein